MAKAREKTLSRGESPYLYGIHDRQGAHLLRRKECVLISDALGSNPDDCSSRSYSDLAEQGLSVTGDRITATARPAPSPHTPKLSTLCATLWKLCGKL
jgi:hypothetical protein